MRYLTILILILTLGSTSCSKKLPYRPVDPFYRAMFNWHPGSYWIMQDSVTGSIDSFYVKSHTITQFESDDVVKETLKVVVAEVNLANPLDTYDWVIDCPNGSSSQYLFLLQGDKFLVYQQYFFRYYKNPTSDITLSVAGKVYDHVFYNTTRAWDTVSAESFSMATQEEHGLLWIKSEFTAYYHNWYLLREHIVRD